MVLKIRKFTEQGKLAQGDADELIAQAKLFEKYLLAYHLDNKVNWHDVRDHPDKYQSLAEYQEAMVAKFRGRPETGGS
jgi:hypothetical protein